MIAGILIALVLAATGCLPVRALVFVVLLLLAGCDSPVPSTILACSESCAGHMARCCRDGCVCRTSTATAGR